jgi:hypothetical protein
MSRSLNFRNVAFYAEPRLRGGSVFAAVNHRVGFFFGRKLHDGGGMPITPVGRFLPYLRWALPPRSLVTLIDAGSTHLIENNGDDELAILAVKLGTMTTTVAAFRARKLSLDPIS